MDGEAAMSDVLYLVMTTNQDGSVRPIIATPDKDVAEAICQRGTDFFLGRRLLAGSPRGR
jgi:hypothetical protein